MGERGIDFELRGDLGTDNERGTHPLGYMATRCAYGCRCGVCRGVPASLWDRVSGEASESRESDSEMQGESDRHSADPETRGTRKTGMRV
jgi:hypothetical protein